MSEAIRVLYVDDRSTERVPGETALKHVVGQDVHVVEAASPEECTTLLDEHAFDLVVCDAASLNDEGKRVLDVLQARGTHLPVLLLPASRSSRTADPAIHSDTEHYRERPKYLDWLPETIESVWQVKTTQRARPQSNQAQSGDERRLPALLDTIPHGVQECDLEGKITYANQAHAQMHGYSVEEMIGKHIWDFKESDSKKRELQDYFNYLIEKQPEPTPYITREITKDGQIIDIQVDWTYLRHANGSLAGFSAIILDITESKRTSDHLKLFSHAIEHSLDGINITDLEGNIIYCNAHSARMYGYTQDELLGQHVDILVKDELYPSHVVIPQIMRTGSWSGEVDQRRNDGTSFPASVTTSLIKNENGEPIGMLGIIRDITEEKHVQAKIRLSEERFRAQYNGIPTPTYTWRNLGNDFILIGFNRASEQVTDGKMHNLLHESASKLYSEEPEMLDNLFQCLNEQSSFKKEMRCRLRTIGQDGTFSFSYVFVPPNLVMVHAEDITERRRAEKLLKLRATQQAAVAKLGLQALKRNQVSAFMDEVVTTVAETLDMELCKILELTSDGKKLRLRAGVGWHEGLVGQETLDTEEKSQAGYTLSCKEPVIVEDLLTETRFRGPKLLKDHHVVSGMSVIIQGMERPFGVLGVHSVSKRSFSPEDVHFLQSVANVLAAAIERDRAENSLRQSDHKNKAILKALPDMMFRLSRSGVHLDFYAAKAKDLFVKPRLFLGRRLDETLPKDVAGLYSHHIGKAFDTKKTQEFEYNLRFPDHELRHYEARMVVSGNDEVLTIVRNITGRKKAEEHLRYHARLLENISDAVFSTDAQLNIVSWNKGAEAIYGWRADEVLGKKTKDILKTEFDRKQSRDTVFKELFEKGSWKGDVTQVKKDGSKVQIAAASSAVKGSDGKMIGTVSVNRDITEQKSIQRSFRFAQFAMDQASDGIYWMTPDARFFYVNDAACESLGYSREELLNMSVHDIDPNYPAEQWPKFWTKLRKEKSFRIESRLRSQAGELFPVEIQVNHLRFEGEEFNCSFVRDIRERQAAEEKLRASEAYYRSLFKNAMNAILIADDSGHYVDANPAACTLLGYRCKELIGTHLSKVTPVADKEKSTATWKEFLRRKTMSGEFRLLRKDGSEVDVEYHAVTNVQPGRHLSIMNDISERKRTEQEVRRWARLFEHAHWGIVITEDGNTIHMLNPAYAEMHGYSVEELIGRSIQDLYVPEDRSNFPRRVEAARARGRICFESEHLRKDGSRFPVLVDVSANRNPKEGPPYQIGHVHDTTERKMAEDALRESEQRFRRIFEEGPLGMAIVDMQYRFVKVNKTLCRMTGYTERELTRLTFPDITHPDDIDKDVRFAAQLFRGELPNYQIEKRYLKKDNKLLWVHLTASVIRDEERTPLYGLAMVKDITERMQNEAELRASRDQLQKLAAHLQSVREEERKRIAREVHDELGQMLSIMQIDLDLLPRQLSDAPPAIKNKIARMSNYIKTTIERVQEIARELRPNLLDTLGLVAAMDWQIKEFSKRTGIKCTFTVRNGDALTLPQNGIATALYRITQEALTNVARHAQATKVQVTLNQRQNRIFLTIRDNGVGAASRKLTASDSLGIIGMRERVAVLGGTFEVGVERNKGTTVKVAVPLRKDDGSESTLEESSNRKLVHSKRSKTH